MAKQERSDDSSDSNPNPLALTYQGQTLADRYRVLKPLGAGGMGTVLLARHTILKKLVAIKVLDSSQVTDADAKNRLFREAQAAAAIGHPNIIDVIDVGVSSLGDPYLVMEYLDGEDLATLIRREGSLTQAAACAVLEPVLNALGAAHSLGVVHRDVKPPNIFLAHQATGELTIKLIDFGVAKLMAPDLSPLTHSGALLGTPSFMSPEQAKGASVDTRSDLYAVGVLIHHMLTGKAPYAESNYHALLHRIATAEPSLATDTLPADVITLLQRCLKKEPEERFQTAAELLEALSLLDGWTARSGALKELQGRVQSSSTIDAELDSEDSLSQFKSVQSPTVASKPVLQPAAVLPDEPPQIGLEATMATPGASVSPVAETHPADRQAQRSPATRALGRMLIAALVLAGGAVMYTRYRAQVSFADHGPSPGSAPPTPSANAATEARATTPPRRDRFETITIQVKGLVEGASLHVDGQQVTENPFQVPASETPVRLRIEKEGYEPFLATVVPTQNQVVWAYQTAKTQSRPLPTPNPTAGRPTPTPEPAAPQMRKSGRDSLYSEDFN